jgi:hypothetical protein
MVMKSRVTLNRSAPVTGQVVDAGLQDGVGALCGGHGLLACGVGHGVLRRQLARALLGQAQRVLQRKGSACDDQASAARPNAAAACRKRENMEAPDGPKGPAPVARWRRRGALNGRQGTLERAPSA